MIRFEPYRAGHVQYITPQPQQAREHAMLIASGGLTLFEGPYALSAWDGLKCIGAAGLIEIRPHRAVAWALLSEDIGPYMLTVVRKVKRALAVTPYTRVEFTVAEGHEEGHRLARLLGAELETPKPMRGFGAWANAEFMYAIIKE